MIVPVQDYASDPSEAFLFFASVAPLESITWDPFFTAITQLSG
jgi:hypothetical protein